MKGGFLKNFLGVWGLIEGEEAEDLVLKELRVCLFVRFGERQLKIEDDEGRRLRLSIGLFNLLFYLFM